MQSVVIVGGGLAGMVTALELARRGRKVTIVEKSARLGGKAGADVVDGRVVEHGYHVFPKWYPNVRALLSQIGVTLVDFDRYHYLLPGQFPTFTTVLGMTGPRAFLHNMMHGLMPWYEELLFFNFTLDLLSRPLSDKKLLDRVSTVGLMRQAWYMTEPVAELQQENMLKASAIPAYEMSAMTAKKIGAYWVRQSDPFLSVLPGDLQSTFIEPLAGLLRAEGVEVRLETEVTAVDVDSAKVTGVKLRSGEELGADAFVLATPFEVTRAWIDGRVYPLDPALGNVHQLEAKPMASMQVRLKKKLDLPREHVFFHGGEYGLSFIDVSQIWPDVPTTHLSFIASNYAPLDALDDFSAEKALLSEVYEYLPIDEADVDTVDMHPNVMTPLFINTIGAWPNRPTPETKIPNLFFAGDYVQNGIDLACMEGAVSAAIGAAAAVLRAAGETAVPAPAVPPKFPRGMLLAARAALFPAVVTSYAVARARELFARGHDGAPPRATARRRSRH